MDADTYLRFVLALGLVLVLIAVLAWLARRYGLGGSGRTRSGHGRRIGVVEVAPVDAKRRLVLIRRDEVEHLVLIGAAGETVVETGIAGGPGQDFATALARSDTASGNGPDRTPSEDAA